MESARGNWGFVVSSGYRLRTMGRELDVRQSSRAASISVVILGAVGGVCLVPIRLSVATPRFRLLLQSILFVGGLLVFVGHWPVSSS